MSAYDPRRDALREIATKTMDAIKVGSYPFQSSVYHLNTKRSEQGTRFYSPNELSNWSTTPSHRAALSSSGNATTHISIIEVSTIDAARLLYNTLQRCSSDCDPDEIGVLNFASATKPGGGFLNGAQAQEESIARSSTLYPTLCTGVARTFYRRHLSEPHNPYYTHAMIYSPGVQIFRDNDGRWTKPIAVDIVTSAAVNAKEVREASRGLARDLTERKIEAMMQERMARILFLFETHGVRNLVLGSFGTGVFRNDIEVIARLWADLLTGPGTRFSHSFDRVIFAIVGWTTFAEFANVFESRSQANSRVAQGPLSEHPALNLCPDLLV